MTTPNLVNDLIRDEGERLQAYKDTVGLWTIGVGHNLDAGGLTDEEKQMIHDGITHQRAIQILQQDINNAVAALDHYQPWWRTLTDRRQDAMVNLCFMGIGSLNTFTTFLKLMRTGQYDAAAADLLQTKYASQVHQRANRIADIIRIGQ